MAGKRRSPFHVPRHWSLADAIDHFSIPEPNTGCSLWLGRYLPDRPYGVVSFHGRKLLAHRAAWEARHGSIPPGLLVRHRCDNPACVNADHLKIGTHGDNMTDMVERGRAFRPYGERNPNAKLTAEQVVHIRSTRTMTGAALARMHGVSESLVKKVRSGQGWARLHRAAPLTSQTFCGGHHG